MTSNSKWFNRITDHKAGICLLRVSNLSRFIEFGFPNAIFDTQAVKIVIIKQIHMYFSFIIQKYWFSVVSGFSFWAIYPKTKTRKSRKFIKNPKILKCENVISKNCWIIVQVTFSKWFSYLANHMPYFYLSRDSVISRFVKLSFFVCLFVLFISVLTLKKLK